MIAMLVGSSSLLDPGVPGEQATLVAQDDVSGVKCERPQLRLFTGEYIFLYSSICQQNNI